MRVPRGERFSLSFPLLLNFTSRKYYTSGRKTKYELRELDVRICSFHSCQTIVTAKMLDINLVIMNGIIRQRRSNQSDRTAINGVMRHALSKYSRPKTRMPNGKWSGDSRNNLTGLTEKSRQSFAMLCFMALSFEIENDSTIQKTVLR